MKKNCAIILPQQAPAYVSYITEQLSAENIETIIYKWDDINHHNIFDTAVYSSILIADAGHVPAFLQNDVDAYLKQGGNIITLGGIPFAEEYYNVNNNEADTNTLCNMMANGSFDKTIILPLDKQSDLNGFVKDTYNPDSKKHDGSAAISIVEGGVTLSHCMKYYADDFVINESFEKDIVIKNGHNVIGFYAKACSNTKTITIQLVEKDGNIFKTRITPSTQFTYFMLSKKDFVYAGNRFHNNYESRPTYVNFQSVEKIQFGHALSHAYSVAGEHTFYISEVATANIALLNDNKVVIDGLYPEYKFHPVTNAVSMKSYHKQAFIEQQEFEVPNKLFSHSPRAQATGFHKKRISRFIPLIEAYDEKGLRCGYGAYMLLNISCSERKSSHNKGSIVVFTPNSDSFYENGGAAAVAQAINSLFLPVVLIEGGSEEYIYFTDQPNAVCGAVIYIRDNSEASNYQVKLSLGNASRTYNIDEFTPLPNTDGLDLREISFEKDISNDVIVTQLIYNDKVCDTLSHKISLYEIKPQSEREFAHIQKGENEVYIGDKPVRFFGVNYMPSCNIGMETWQEFEHYVASFAYDPDIIETDLIRIKDIGINSVSIFMHYEPSIHSNNILHLVKLCQKHGLYVDLAIRPKANPFDFDEKEVNEMITKYRFHENDTIVAYDIAWERYVGTYEACYGNFNGRKSFDENWQNFLLNHYGSYEKAESIFGCKLPRSKNGDVIGVSDDMLRADGEHTVMVAVFRRFIDEQVAYAHIKAMQFIRSVDPNHMISPRTGDASTIPLVDPGIYGYDYKALSYSMDFMSPESYALTDHYSSMKQGIFTNIYSRYANPDNVIQWKEFGKSIWIGSNFTDNSTSLEWQAEYYRRFFDMLIAGHTSGLYAWWWAGGYRVGENSDFGIIAPDGSDRPVTSVFREYAERFIHAPHIKPIQKQIYIDRDLHADGLLSLYRSIEQELYSAIESGGMVELIDNATGKTSADVELTEVGNTAPCGCVPKYINGIFTNIVVSDGKLSPQEIKNGDTISVGSTAELYINFTVINTEKSTWLCGNEYGCVSLQSDDASDFTVSIPLVQDIPYLSYATFSTVINCERKGDLCVSLSAKDRTKFGEHIIIHIQ